MKVPLSVPVPAGYANQSFQESDEMVSVIAMV
jgi:hypothetical protein